MRRTGVFCTGLLAALGAATRCAAATIELTVVDEAGKPLPDVAVYATAAHGPADGATRAAAAHPGAAPTAVMDQQGQQFVPHVLVVRTGTQVTFPNSDSVSHHVYSFSPAKPFELGLYKGNVYPPVTFDKPGIVVVGCNIHDGMLGYIRVVDTPHFTVTNAHGVAVIDGVPIGDYSVEVWTPRAREESLPPARHVHADSGGVAAEVRITGRLAPAHGHGGAGLKWDRY